MGLHVEAFQRRSPICFIADVSGLHYQCVGLTNPFVLVGRPCPTEIKIGHGFDEPTELVIKDFRVHGMAVYARAGTACRNKGYSGDVGGLRKSLSSSSSTEFIGGIPVKGGRRTTRSWTMHEEIVDLAFSEQR